MQQFNFKKTSISGLTLIEPFLAPDNRGYFSKTFERGIFEANGIVLPVFEELRSFSKRGVIRGLHFQREHSQDKLVQVLNGAVYDAAVDLREGSKSFGKWEGFYLDAEKQNLLYIPKGFAHGFLALEENTLFSYLCGDQYNPGSDGGIRWDDPDIAVKWPVGKAGKLMLSDKDAALPSFREFVEEYGALSVSP